MYAFVTLLLTRKEKLFGPSHFFGLATQLDPVIFIYETSVEKFNPFYFSVQVAI